MKWLVVQLVIGQPRMTEWARGVGRESTSSFVRPLKQKAIPFCSCLCSLFKRLGAGYVAIQVVRHVASAPPPVGKPPSYMCFSPQSWHRKLRTYKAGRLQLDASFLLSPMAPTPQITGTVASPAGTLKVETSIVLKDEREIASSNSNDNSEITPTTPEFLRAQKDRHLFRKAFEDNMKNKPVKHDKVFVLLLSWEDSIDDCNVKPEVRMPAYKVVV